MKTWQGLLAVSALGMCAGAGISRGQEPGLSLGTREWPAVTNGLVFFNGEYIPPPYTVSRVENVVVINGRRIESGIPWPPPKAEPPAQVPESDPVMPSTITETTTNFDSDFIKYVSDKRQYLFDRFGRDKGIELMVEVYKGLPCILNAERDATSPVGIVLFWKSGKVSRVDLVPPSRKPNTTTKEQALKMMDRLCESYVEGLEDNHFFMLGNTFLRGAPDGYKMLLAPLSEAMKQATNEAHFASLFRTNRLSGSFSEGALRSLYQHKDGLPKWEPRVREAVEKERR